MKGGVRATGKVANDDLCNWREAWVLFPGNVVYVWHAGLFTSTIYESLRACGSGSTIIAAERLRRRCFAMEIDPVYCDVTVTRWEDFTGVKAERERAKRK